MTIFEVSPRGFSLMPHGFFTRNGGVSSETFSSLNGSLKVGDKEENVFENRKRALRALGLEDKKFFIPNIVHGDNAIVVDETSDVDTISNTDADALITLSPHVALGITYADCVPVLMASTDGKLVAVIHAGWRGIARQVIIKTVEKARSLLSCDVKIMAAVGPAISEAGFLVNGEALDFFARFWPSYTKVQGEGGFVHLTGIAKAQLSHTEIDLVEKVGGFTDLDASRYFSHRRDRTCGRHLAIIAKKKPVKR